MQLAVFAHVVVRLRRIVSHRETFARQVPIHSPAAVGAGLQRVSFIVLDTGGVYALTTHKPPKKPVAEDVAPATETAA